MITAIRLADHVKPAETRETYSFLNYTVVLELLTESILISVPSEAASCMSVESRYYKD
jgi:hypothetical protein